MAGLLRDKYFLLCIATAFVIVSSTFFTDDADNGRIVGAVQDVKSSSNGFVFTLEDSDGDPMRCFSRIQPEAGSVYEINGDWSDDRTIFFVDSMTRLS